MKKSAFLCTPLAAASCIHAFVSPQPHQSQRISLQNLRQPWSLNQVEDENMASLPPSTNNNADPSSFVEQDILGESSKSASVATMIPQETKRVLIEELGYRRVDVERLKFDLAPVLVERRLRCPEEGMPESWCRSQAELQQENSMMRRLENESQYPLKVPLLGISLILFGKGFSDALITIIKVNISFPGVSLADEFMGVPVLLIDVVCVTAGAALGWWTWKTMK
jgi:hypothetical protein